MVNYEKKNDIDWILVKTEYETTQISQRKIAAKYNISYSTLKYRATQEKWAKNKEKKLGKIDAKLTQKTINNVIADKEKVLKTHFNISQKFIDMITNTLKENPYLDDKKVLNYVTAIEKLQRMQRQTLKLDLDLDNADNSKEKINEFLDATKKSEKELSDLYDEDEK